MKKNFTLILALAAVTMTMNAQLKVNSSGIVLIGDSTELGTGYIARFESNKATTTGFNIGVAGIMNMPASGGPACGLYGKATNGLYGHNYGVVGLIKPNENGASVYGANTSSYYGINGNYAGYFMGNACVTGTFSANQYLNPSDIRLKENIRPFSSRKESTLDKVIDMNVVEYSYKNIIPSIILPDSLSAEEVVKQSGMKPGKKHFGLIAQELQQLYPELVEEGQDGYLAVNYVELVPILIRSIQELKRELDEVRDGNDVVRMSRSLATALTSANASSNVLYQNTPNPFKEQTTIRFSLADDAKNAAICIFDMTGKMLKKLPVSSGETSVSINGWELGEGMFLYTLMVNGREIDTKKMIITK